MIVGAYKAKTKLPELLRIVRDLHEEVIITNRGENVAKLVPISDAEKGMKQVISEIKEFRTHIQPDAEGMSIKEMIEEGRKY